jgi:hypothetical protein
VRTHDGWPRHTSIDIALAHNTATPHDVLAALAGNVDGRVRHALCRFPHVAGDILETVWENRDLGVAMARAHLYDLASAANTPDTVIEQMDAGIVNRSGTGVVRLAKPDGNHDHLQLIWGLAGGFCGTVGELRDACDDVLAQPA